MSRQEQDRQPERVEIQQVPIGLPEYSFNIIAGSPVCGKTTLAHQFLAKFLGGVHSVDRLGYEITERGIIIDDALRGYRALTSGISEPWSMRGNDDSEPRRNRRRTKPPGRRPR